MRADPIIKEIGLKFTLLLSPPIFIPPPISYNTNVHMYIGIRYVYIYIIVFCFLLLTALKHAENLPIQKFERFPLPLGEFRSSASTADLEDPSRGSHNNAGNGDVSELQIDKKNP